MAAIDPHPDSRTHKSLKVNDFLSRKNTELDSPEDTLSAGDTLIEGSFLHQELRNGLFLHVSDAREEHAFTVRSQIGAGLSCIFFLEGNVDIEIGDRGFAFNGRQKRGDVIEATAIVNARPDSFLRRSASAQPVRHLVISASPEWLGLDGIDALAEQGGLQALFTDHLNARRWTIAPRMIELVRQIVAPPPFIPELRNLYLEGRAVEIMGETLSILMSGERAAIGEDLITRKETTRLERAKDFIAANITAPLSVENIAREAGLNPSGLQKIFQLSEGMSIFAYVRKQRLERSLFSLQAGECSVAEASVIAGYSSPTNFATAFKRAFGLSPRDASMLRPTSTTPRA